MQFTITGVLAFAATAAFAAPLEARNYDVCPNGLSPVCCATTVLNLLGANCPSPPITPTTPNQFIEVCAGEGQQAKCCGFSIVEQAILCQDVEKTANPPADKVPVPEVPVPEVPAVKDPVHDDSHKDDDSDDDKGNGSGYGNKDSDYSNY